MLLTSKHNRKTSPLLRILGSFLLSVVLSVNVFGAFAEIALAENPPATTKTFAEYMSDAKVASDIAVAAGVNAGKPGTSAAQALADSKTSTQALGDVSLALRRASDAAAKISDPAEKQQAITALRAAQNTDTGLQAAAGRANSVALEAARNKAQTPAEKAAVQSGAAAGVATVRAAQTAGNTGGGVPTNETNASHPLELCVSKLLLSMCVAGVAYIFLVDLTSPLAYLGGALFDSFAGISLQSGTYASAVIAKGWVIARDVANMAFVFILIYFAFLLILNIEGVGVAKQVASVIAVALLINFSFFFSRVVIDASNILANEFYRNIDAAPAASSQSITISGVQALASGANTIAGAVRFDTKGNAQIKSISAKVMAGINPQDLLGNETFLRYLWGKESGLFNNIAILLTLFFIFGIINIILAAVFVTAAFQFLARTISLWFAIILSPIAFIAFITPNGKGLWTKWLKLILSNAFYAPAFLFVLYIMIKMLDNGLLSNDIASFLAGSVDGQAPAGQSAIQGFLNRIVGVVLRLAVVVGLLIAALKIGSYFSLQGSKLAEKWGGQIGIGGGARLVGWAARSTGGAIGANFARSRLVRNLATATSRLGPADAQGNRAPLPGLGNAVLRSAGVAVGRAGQIAGLGAAKASFDFRASGMPKMDMGGKPQTGGYLQDVADETKRLTTLSKDNEDGPEDKLLREEKVTRNKEALLADPAFAADLKNSINSSNRNLANIMSKVNESNQAIREAILRGDEAGEALARKNNMEATSQHVKALQEHGKLEDSLNKAMDLRVNGPDDATRKSSTASYLASRGVHNMWRLPTGLKLGRSGLRASQTIKAGKSDKDKFVELAKSLAAEGAAAPTTPTPPHP